MTLAEAYNAVAEDLLPWISDATARGDAQSLQDAEALRTTVNALLTASGDANTANMEAKLAADAAACQHLKAFTAEGDAKAKAIAAQQKDVGRMVKLATDVASFCTSAASGNLAGGAGALSRMCADLGVSL